jgi:hypothetical protein
MIRSGRLDPTQSVQAELNLASPLSKNRKKPKKEEAEARLVVYLVKF